MKRILFFLLLLVNLQLTMDNGSLRIGFGEVSAQRVKEEQLAKTVRSTKTVTRGGSCWCPNCNEYFTEKEYEEHFPCPMMEVTCSWCGKRMKYYQLRYHICDQLCMICHQPMDECTCEGGVGIGKDKSGGSNGSFFDDDDDDFDDGGEIGGATSQSGKEKKKHKHISLNDFLSLKGVKFLGNKKMTKASQGLNNMKTLHPQQDGVYECVPNAFAFMMELNGADYNTIQQILKDAAENEGYSMQQILPNTDSPQQTGFPMDIEYETLQSVFENYIQIVEYPNNFEDVEKCIDNGIPVAAYDNGCPQHMVVIIGYDDNNYYVSGGNEYGDVSVVNRMFLNGDSVFGIK